MLNQHVTFVNRYIIISMLMLQDTVRYCAVSVGTNHLQDTVRYCAIGISWYEPPSRSLPQLANTALSYALVRPALLRIEKLEVILNSNQCNKTEHLRSLITYNFRVVA
jgi:hypothetical protein